MAQEGAQGNSPTIPTRLQRLGRSREGCPSHLDTQMDMVAHMATCSQAPVLVTGVGVTALCHLHVFAGVG